MAGSVTPVFDPIVDYTADLLILTDPELFLILVDNPDLFSSVDIDLDENMEPCVVIHYYE